jgi:hypothetical protein
MLGQSSATVRRLIDRRHLSRVPAIAAVRVPHASVEALLQTGATTPFDLTRELKQNGPCLVFAPEALASMYQLHIQTVYRMLARSALPTVEWLWSRRVLKSEVYRTLGGAPPPREMVGGADSRLPIADELGSRTGKWITQPPQSRGGSEGSAHTFVFRPPEP